MYAASSSRYLASFVAVSAPDGSGGGVAWKDTHDARAEEIKLMCQARRFAWEPSIHFFVSEARLSKKAAYNFSAVAVGAHLTGLDSCR